MSIPKNSARLSKAHSRAPRGGKRGGGEPARTCDQGPLLWWGLRLRRFLRSLRGQLPRVPGPACLSGGCRPNGSVPESGLTSVSRFHGFIFHEASAPTDLPSRSLAEAEGGPLRWSCFLLQGADVRRHWPGRVLRTRPRLPPQLPVPGPLPWGHSSADGAEQGGVEGIKLVAGPAAAFQNCGTFFWSLGCSGCFHDPPHLLFSGPQEFLPF